MEEEIRETLNVNIGYIDTIIFLMFAAIRNIDPKKAVIDFNIDKQTTKDVKLTSVQIAMFIFALLDRIAPDDDAVGKVIRALNYMKDNQDDISISENPLQKGL